MLHAGPHERKQLAQKLPEKMRAYQRDTKAIVEIPNAREYVLTESVEGAGLVEVEIYNTVVEGAKYATCVRDVFPVVSMRTDTMRVPYGNAGIVAPLKQEGAEFAAMYQDYNYRTLTAETYGHTIPIAKELVDDAKFDLLNIEFMKVGQSVENRLNYDTLQEIIDNAGNEIDTAGSNQGIIALIKAKAETHKDGFYPDKIVIHPELWSMVFQDYKPSYNTLAEENLRSGALPDVVGMRPYVCSVPITTTGSRVWGYNTGDYIGGVVVDSMRGAIIGMREDITVKPHENVLKMIYSPIVYARMDVSYLNANALCRIRY